MAAPGDDGLLARVIVLKVVFRDLRVRPSFKVSQILILERVRFVFGMTRHEEVLAASMSEQIGTSLLGDCQNLELGYALNRFDGDLGIA